MPCDTIQTNTLEVGTMNGKLLAAALTALGATGVSIGAGGRASFTLEGARCTLGGGRFTVPAGYEYLGDKVKQAYSRQAVIYSARKNGWTIKETRPNCFAIVK